MCQSHQGPPFLPAHLLNEPLAAGSTELPITFQLPRLTDPFQAGTPRPPITQTGCCWPWVDLVAGQTLPKEMLQSDGCCLGAFVGGAPTGRYYRVHCPLPPPPPHAAGCPWPPTG